MTIWLNAASRQDALCTGHRHFLEAVTGLNFDQRFLDPVHGLTFRAIERIDCNDEFGFLVLDSIINDPADFMSLKAGRTDQPGKPHISSDIAGTSRK